MHIHHSFVVFQGVAVIKDRLLQAQGHKVADSQLPFEKVGVRSTPAARPQQQQQQQQQQQFSKVGGTLARSDIR